MTASDVAASERSKMTGAEKDQMQDAQGVDPALPEEGNISRRALLAGSAAFAVAASTSTAMAGGHHDDHHDHHESSGGNGDLVRAAGACETAGEICQAHCQSMLAKGDTSLAACSASVSEMTASCSALMRLAAVNSSHLPAMAKLCAQILEDCKAACDKHAKHDECKACAEACEACLAECKKGAA